MKVKIGPYLNWYGPYQIAELICKPLWWLSKGQVHDFGCWLSGGEKDSILTKICNWIWDKRKRTVKIKIDDYDAWNAFETISIIILPLLKEVKKQKSGIPCCMPGYNESVDMNHDQTYFEFMRETDSEVSDYASKKWDEILDEMIWTFEQLQPDYDWEAQYWITQPKLDLKEYPEDEGKIVVPVRWEVKGECDWEGMKRHQERIDAGLQLFAKYYGTLWT